MRTLIAVFIAGGLVGCTLITGASDLETAREEVVHENESTEPKSGATNDATSSTTPWIPDMVLGDGGGRTTADTGAAGSSSTKDKEPVLCGSTTCAPGKPCCHNELNRSCSATDQCEGGNALAVRCNGRAGCGTGEICCLEVTNGGAQCRAEASCTGFIFCRTSADCPDGRTCQPMGGSFSEHGNCL